VSVEGGRESKTTLDMRGTSVDFELSSEGKPMEVVVDPENRYLRISGRIAADPSGDLRPPRIDKALPRFLSTDEVDALLQAPDTKTPRGLRDRAMLEVLYATGLRVTELVKLRLTEIQREGGYLQFVGKGNKERIVPLGETARDWIDRYMRDARPVPDESRAPAADKVTVPRRRMGENGNVVRILLYTGIVSAILGMYRGRMSAGGTPETAIFADEKLAD